MVEKNSNTKFEKALKEFELVYMPSRNWSSHTRRAYQFDITDLIQFLASRGKNDPKDVDLVDLEAYMAKLDHRELAGTTRRRKTWAIKTFFSFLTQYGYASHNVALKLIPPKTEKKEPRFLTETEYKSLLRACSHEPRDAAIIELLLQTGIRLSELANLKVDDIELPRKITRDPMNMGRLHIIGKGKKERTIPLNYKASKVLKAWLAIRPEVDSDSLFTTKFRQPMGARSFEYVVKKYLKEAGIKGASCHTLRHTMATHHVAKGTSLKTVQEILGHEDLRTTSVYVSLAKELMRKELQEHAL